MQRLYNNNYLTHALILKKKGIIWWYLDVTNILCLLCTNYIHYFWKYTCLYGQSKSDNNICFDQSVHAYEYTHTQLILYVVTHSNMKPITFIILHNISIYFIR